jgi:hypothetical protein
MTWLLGLFLHSWQNCSWTRGDAAATAAGRAVPVGNRDVSELSAFFSVGRKNCSPPLGALHELEELFSSWRSCPRDEGVLLELKELKDPF